MGEGRRREAAPSSCYPWVVRSPIEAHEGGQKGEGRDNPARSVCVAPPHAKGGWGVTRRADPVTRARWGINGGGGKGVVWGSALLSCASHRGRGPRGKGRTFRALICPHLCAAAGWCQPHARREGKAARHVSSRAAPRGGAPRPCGIRGRGRGAYTPNAPLPLCTHQFLCICGGRAPRAGGREKREEEGRV